MKKHPLLTSIAVFIISVVILMGPFYFIGFYFKLGSWYFEEVVVLYGTLVGFGSMGLAQIVYEELTPFEW